MTAAQPLDGTAPVWISRHEPHLAPRRMDRPRFARVASLDPFRAKLERTAATECPAPDASIVAVERHIVSCMRHEAAGRHMAPVTDATITRAWQDWQTLHTAPVTVDPLAGDPTDAQHAHLLDVIRVQSEVTR